jgi:hypothetical protein
MTTVGSGEGAGDRDPQRSRVVIAVLITALVGALDFALGVGLVADWQTRAYARTEGRILSSAVETSRVDDQQYYGLAITYAYDVAGRTFEGRRYAARDLGDSSGDWQAELVASLPSGKLVPVYYDRAEPRRAVLVPGLPASDHFWALLLLPFNLLAWLMWSNVVAAARARREDRPWSNELRPLGMGMLGAGAAAFLSLFVVAIGFGLNPPRGVIGSAWAATFVAGVVFGLRARVRRV